MAVVGVAALALVVGVAVRVGLKAWRMGLPSAVDAATAAGHPGGRRLAYLGEAELALVEGGRIVARAPGKFRHDEHGPVWTANGRYVAAVTNPDSADAAIIAVDSSTGDVFTVRCAACSHIASFGTHEVIWVDGQHQLARADLDQHAGARPVTLASSTTFSQRFDVLAGLPQLTLFVGADVGTTAAYGGPESLVLVSVNGQVRQVGQTESDSGVGRAAAASITAYGGPRIAYVNGLHSGRCEHVAGVALLDPVSGQTHATHAAVLNRLPDGGSAVRDLWWGDDHELYATMQSWDCRGGEPAMADPTLWRLDATTWVSVNRESARAIRQGDDAVYAVLGNSANWDDPAPLLWTTGPSRTLVNPKVFAISTPPPADSIGASNG